MKPNKSCTVCGKHRAQECSHVQCPNRKPITAQQTGAHMHLNWSATRKVPKQGGEHD